MRGKRLGALAGAACFLAAGSAIADSAPLPAALDQYSDPASVVLAVRADFAPPGGEVRLAVYENDEAFLERAAIKHQATVGEDGVAVMPLRGLKAGDYAFVAYYDANGDGRLNRGGVLGKPQEPFAFSNGVKPKLRKPRFDETKVKVEPGAVVLITLDD